MADDLPFRSEYAKSNRSSCKSCKEKITKDDLRMAAMVQSPMFDGKTPNWYHFRCFFAKFKVKTVGDIGHFEILRYEDQERIKQKLSTGISSSTPCSSGKGKRKTTQSSLSTEVTEFSTEYAKSNKSSCKGCKEKIEKGVMRISRLDRESETARRFGPSPAWYHWECFIQIRENLEFYEEAEKIPGFNALGIEDQKKLKDKIKKIAPKIKDEVDSKKQKLDIKEGKVLKEQSDFIFNYRDWLRENLKKKEMSDIFFFNDQEVPSGESKMLDRLSDIMSFGCLEKCTECQGQLVFHNDGYRCTGNLTEWTKCQFITKNPKRRQFEIPDDLKEEYSFLNKYKFKKGDRKFPSVQASPSVPKNELSTTKVKKALDYTKIFLGAKLDRPKEEIKKLILDLGGTVVSKVDETVACVIASEDEVKKMTKKIKEAQDLDIQIVKEEFLDDIQKGDSTTAALIVKHNIASWGSSPEKRIGASAMAGLKMASKSSSSRFASNKSMKQKVTVKGGAAVDPDSGIDDIAHVLMDNKTPFNAVLGKVDIIRGQNSFYKLQILESDVGNRYWVFRSWGRVGTTVGGTKLDDHDTKIDAVIQFKNLYEEKSGNMWVEREHFEKKPNCFYPLDIDYGQEDANIAKLMPGKNSKLHKSIQELICLIFDVDKMRKAMVEFEIDLEKMPLGKLSKKHIQKAFSVLTELQDIIKNGSNQFKLTDASTRFYTLIPHNFGMEKPPLLDTEEIIKIKIDMIESLLEIEVAYSLLKDTSEEDKKKDPIDQHYEQLKAKIEVLDKKSEEFQTFQTYIANTHAATHNTYDLEIEQVFKVDRQGEAKRFKPFKQLENHYLLWHGSRTTNYAGILANGLKIAPPEAPVTGYMFGKGIYFADMVSKSANYCYSNKSNSTGLLLLCDVALGNMYELTQAESITKLPKNKHSTKGVGRTQPDPNSSITDAQGITIPLGKGIPSKDQNSTLLYNEYIVYDTAQVNIKYLLQVNFKWKY